MTFTITSLTILKALSCLFVVGVGTVVCWLFIVALTISESQRGIFITLFLLSIAVTAFTVFKIITMTY